MACHEYHLQIFSAVVKRHGLISLQKALELPHAECFKVHTFLCRSAAWHGTTQGDFLLQETVGKPRFGLYFAPPLAQG